MTRRILWLLLSFLGLTAVVAAHSQNAVLRDAPGTAFLSNTDCNSPAHWDGDTFFIFNSDEYPVRSAGGDQFTIANPTDCSYSNTVSGGRWIECTWKDDNSVLYGWYHHEPKAVCKNDKDLTAPKIGAAKSLDNGLHWTDLGIVLEAPPGTNDCSYKNGWFVGGHGDFSGMLSQDGKYFYIFYSNYAGRLVEQGAAVARMPWKDRDNPIGKFRKYYGGKWEEPGIGGRSTPYFPANKSWARLRVDAFWGPSIHWNTYLKKYVVLLNHAVGTPKWPQEGVYVSFGDSLSRPESWTTPRKITDGKWYPQVLGLNTKAGETDKLCGQVGRFYMNGVSRKEIVFLRDGDDPAKAPPVYRPARVQARRRAVQ